MNRLILLTLLLMGGAALAAAPATLPSTRPAQAVTWLTNLEKAYADAQAGNKPIFACVGADWCPWCRKLEQELVKSELQAKLANFICLRLNVDSDREAARALRVEGVPALRMLDPDGRMIASADGYMPAASLIKWLDESLGRATGKPRAEIGARKPLDEAMIKSLIVDFADADPTVREAAAGRLCIDPRLTAAPVIDAFARGDLATRLSALEVLSQWQAPLAGMDPWRPETITSESLQKLRGWSKQIAQAPPRPTTIPASEIAAARQEIARMLKAQAPMEVRACRERLARVGPALLEEIFAQLKSADTQVAHERLTALRYRVVASSALALTSANLFDRLAASDINIRHKALDELAARATADDKELLLQLFSDPDELMRESALKTLQQLGTDASDALVRLLNDPMPNVRAAVLKQLAESPNAKLIPNVVDYIAKEKDADLVVHAVRVLRAAKSADAVDCLVKLLEHESWRVRAESIEALQETEGRANREARIQSAIAKRLEDPDGYVVSRAIAALGQSSVGGIVAPLSRAVEKHPELAAEIVRMLTEDEKAATLISPELRKFAANANADIRAAGITGLCAIYTTGIDKEVIGALKDDARGVRVAAAEGIFVILERQRPEREGEMVVRRSFGGLRRRNVDARIGLPEWLTEFRSGTRRDKWLDDAAPQLLKMTESADVPERIAGALPLVALGQEQRVVPMLLETAKTNSAYCQVVAQALPWLPIDGRVALFKQIMALKPNPEQLHRIASLMAIIPEDPAALALWQLLDDRADDQLAEVIEEGLLSIYGRQRSVESGSSYSPGPQTAPIKELKRRAAQGSDAQRMVALAVLLQHSLGDTAETATAVREDARAPASLRLDALQVLLASQSKRDGAKTALGAINSGKPEEVKLAIGYLATNGRTLSTLHGMYLSFTNPELERGFVYGDSAVALPSAPEGLKPEMLSGYLNDSDADTAAYTGYLLALMGDRKGFDKLAAHWRANKHESYDQWRQMLYTAAAAMNDDELTPVLTEVYNSFQKGSTYELRTFYRTIRGMDGKKMLELRRQMRKDVGASLLQ